MGSVRRLARMLASPTHTYSTAPPRQDAGSGDAADPWADFRDDLWLPPSDLVLPTRGTDRGRLTRLDSLGLVVRVKRPDEAARPR